MNKDTHAMGGCFHHVFHLKSLFYFSKQLLLLVTELGGRKQLSRIFIVEINLTQLYGCILQMTWAQKQKKRCLISSSHQIFCSAQYPFFLILFDLSLLQDFLFAHEILIHICFGLLNSKISHWWLIEGVHFYYINFD